VIVIAKSGNTKNHLENNNGTKIFIVSSNIGITGSGLHTDLRIIVKKARKIARKFQNNFGEQITIKQLLKDLSIFVQEYTHTGGVRPFGISIFVAGFDESGPNLFQINPSGSFFKINWGGIGKNSNLALDFLKKRWNKDLELEDCIKLGLNAFQETSDSPIGKSQIQIGLIDETCFFFVFNQNQISRFIETLENQ